MSQQLEQPHPDPLADEPRLKPALRQPHNSGGIPGTIVIVACLGIDLALIMATTAVRTLISSELGESMALGAFYGILAAQVAMAAIWLGILASALYWMLLGMVMFSFTVLALLPEVKANPLYQALEVAKDERDVFMTDPIVAGAMAHSTVLSLPVVLEFLEPELARAVANLGR